MITLDTRKVKAVLFDFDGTLVDTEIQHFESFKKVLKSFNHKYVSFKRHKQIYLGKGSMFILESEKAKHNLSLDTQFLLMEKKKTYVRLIEKADIKPIRGLIDLLGKLSQKGVKFAIVSGGQRENVEMVLGKAGIPHFYQVFITGDDLTNPKPDPEGFLKALRELRLNVSDVVVFEDGQAGIQAGLNAGMKTIALTSSLSSSYLKRLFPTIETIADFTQVKVV